MADIIQFPSKKDFAEKFRGEVPDHMLEGLQAAYDRVVELKNKYPKAEFRVSDENADSARQLVSDYSEYALMLLERILVLEAELCMLKKAT